MRGTMIREAVNKDLHDVISLCYDFYNESKTAKIIPLDILWLIENVKNFISSDDVIVLVAVHNDNVVGVIIGAISPSWFSPIKIAQEAVWYVRKENRGVFGINLLNKFEEECIKKGAHLSSIAYMDEDMNLDTFLKRFNYSKVDVNHMKVLQPWL